MRLLDLGVRRGHGRTGCSGRTALATIWKKRRTALSERMGRDAASLAPWTVKNRALGGPRATVGDEDEWCTERR